MDFSYQNEITMQMLLIGVFNLLVEETRCGRMLSRATEKPAH